MSNRAWRSSDWLAEIASSVASIKVAFFIAIFFYFIVYFCSRMRGEYIPFTRVQSDLS